MRYFKRGHRIYNDIKKERIARLLIKKSRSFIRQGE